MQTLEKGDFFSGLSIVPAKVQGASLVTVWAVTRVLVSEVESSNDRVRTFEEIQDNAFNFLQELKTDVEDQAIGIEAYESAVETMVLILGRVAKKAGVRYEPHAF